MKKWTDGVDIFEKEFIIIPVHERFVYIDFSNIFALLLISSVLVFQTTLVSRHRMQPEWNSATIRSTAGVSGLACGLPLCHSLTHSEHLSARIYIIDSLNHARDRAKTVLTSYLNKEAVYRGKLKSEKDAVEPSFIMAKVRILCCQLASFCQLAPSDKPIIPFQRLLNKRTTATVGSI